MKKSFKKEQRGKLERQAKRAQDIECKPITETKPEEEEEEEGDGEWEPKEVAVAYRQQEVGRCRR